MPTHKWFKANKSARSAHQEAARLYDKRLDDRYQTLAEFLYGVDGNVMGLLFRLSIQLLPLLLEMYVRKRKSAWLYLPLYEIARNAIGLHYHQQLPFFAFMTHCSLRLFTKPSVFVSPERDQLSIYLFTNHSVFVIRSYVIKVYRSNFSQLGKDIGTNELKCLGESKKLFIFHPFNAGER